MVSGSRIQVESLWFRVSGFGFRVSGFGFGFQALGFGFQVSGCMSHLPCFVFRVPGCGVQVLILEFVQREVRGFAGDGQGCGCHDGGVSPRTGPAIGVKSRVPLCNTTHDCRPEIAIDAPP